MRSNLKGLISRLNPYCTRALEAASGLCVNRSHYEVSIAHMLLQLLDDAQADVQLLLKHFEIDSAVWIKELQDEIESFKNGNPGKPVFSAALMSCLEGAWMVSSVDFSQQQTRSAALLTVLSDNPNRYGTDFLSDIHKISFDEINKQFDSLIEVSSEVSRLSNTPATTWSEYKKYFEKDPALARRFQLVKLDEPSVDDAVVILRGLREVYEKAHDVYIQDEAIETAASMSARYITGRQLPDKAVDLLDTACARVKISLTTKPAALEDLQRQTQILQREHKALQRDVNSSRSKQHDRLARLEESITENQQQLEKNTEEWKQQQQLVDQVVSLRTDEEADTKQLATAIKKLQEFQKDKYKIAYEVTSDVVAQVIADWTGVPVGNVVKDQAASLLEFNDKMKAWMKGQDHAIDVIDAGVRTAKAGIQNPDQPHGIFLFVGPSGVGKTETALGVANLLFGGEQFMTTINMSEYQEKHTVSRLLGSPAGYVGYGEGGVLSEAVRQRPYSVVLLDEVEKADLEVMNLFYQVFDKGTLSDGEGRSIDFKNTIVFLTSNLASATIMKMCENGTPSIEELTEAIRPELQAHFKPALLARMTIVPFLPIKDEVLKSIVAIKLKKIGQRLQNNQSLEFIYGDDVIEHISNRCTDIESGARNIDHIVSKNLLPLIATEILNDIGNETEYHRLH